MLTWQITVRSDEGHKRSTWVEAADVAGAIAASGAEAGSICSVGVYEKKRPPVPAIIAGLGLTVYVAAIMFENWWTAFSGGNGWMFLAFLAFFGTMMFLMRKQFITPSSDSQSPVTWHNNSLAENPLFQSPLLQYKMFQIPVWRLMLLISLWVVPFVAMFLAYEVIMNGGGVFGVFGVGGGVGGVGGVGEEALSAQEALIPILLFAGAALAAKELAAEAL